MKTHKTFSYFFISAIIFLILPGSFTLSQVLKIDEIDRQGILHQINFRRFSYPIIDINSTLRIEINKEILRAKAAKLKSISQQYNAEDLIAITGILKMETELLQIIGSITGSYEERKEKLDLFSRRMLDLMMFVQKQKNLKSQVEKILGSEETEPGQEYSLIIDLVREEMNRIGKEIEKTLQEQRIYFRLGGWLRNENGALQPIHIPQFDNYEEGKFYEVPRFIMPASEELAKQYEEAVIAAEEYNKKGATEFDRIKTQISAFRDSLKFTLLCVDENFKKTINLTTETQKVKNLIKPFLDQLDILIKSVKDVAKIIQEITESSDPLASSITSIDKLLILFKGIETNLPLLSELYSATINKLTDKLPVEAKDIGKNFLKESSKCFDSLKTYEDKVNLLLNTIGKWSDLSVPKQVVTNLEFTENVNRFFIEDIPESTELDLRYTGQRFAGDEIYLKATLEKKTETDQKPESVEIEHRTFTMFQIGLHSQLTAGVIFLDPLDNSATKLTKQFQAAPSYSLLFKWGSRKSYIYNKFWNVGVGINVAAPDFNLDSTPEIALGVMATTALDYLQLGFGRNFGVETWYWFFGLRLPAGTVTLTGDENKSVK